MLPKYANITASWTLLNFLAIYSSKCPSFIEGLINSIAACMSWIEFAYLSL